MFPGWDLAFYYADVYDDNTYLNLKRVNIIGPPPFPPIVQPIIEREHARITMVGAAADLALGNWLLKARSTGGSRCSPMWWEVPRLRRPPTRPERSAMTLWLSWKH